MSPLPLGAIDYEDQLVDGFVSLMGGHWYLGDTTKVATLREAQPQDDDEIEILSKGEHPAILISVERQGNVDSPAVDLEEMRYLARFDVVVEGQTSRTEGKKVCGRIREELVSYVVELDGSGTVVTDAAQLWVDKGGIDAGTVQTGLKKNRHIFWARVTIPLSLYWTRVSAS